MRRCGVLTGRGERNNRRVIPPIPASAIDARLHDIANQFILALTGGRAIDGKLHDMIGNPGGLADKDLLFVGFDSALPVHQRGCINEMCLGHGVGQNGMGLG